jgi:hypothetical protein
MEYSCAPCSDHGWPFGGYPGFSSLPSNFLKSEAIAAFPPMLYAARTQVGTPHYLLGVPELSKLQVAGASPEAAPGHAPQSNVPAMG